MFNLCWVWGTDDAWFSGESMFSRLSMNGSFSAVDFWETPSTDQLTGFVFLHLTPLLQFLTSWAQRRGSFSSPANLKGYTASRHFHQPLTQTFSDSPAPTPSFFRSSVESLLVTVWPDSNGSSPFKQPITSFPLRLRWCVRVFTPYMPSNPVNTHH